MSKLNKIKKLIIELAEYNFPETVFDDLDWSMDYDENLDAELQQALQKFYRLLKKSLKHGLKDHTESILSNFCDEIENISNFFSDVSDDVEKILWGDDGQLPDIPEGYVLPAHYNYVSEA